MRNPNNASLNTIRATVHLTDQEMRRLVSSAMTQLYAEKQRRGLSAVEVSLVDKIEAARRANPGAL